VWAMEKCRLKQLNYYGDFLAATIHANGLSQKVGVQDCVINKNAVVMNDGVLVFEIKSGFAGRRCRKITEPKSLSHCLVGKS
jgi:hypothetical protein